jgi:peptidoglycan/LPS O-acetylase OafA/YrhL
MSLFRRTEILDDQSKPPSEPPALEGGTPSAGRVVAIDGLRAMAMLMVYLYHTWEFGDSPKLQVWKISFGDIIRGFSSGVDLFMVLSGFCLFWPLAKRPAIAEGWDSKDFARRRVRRILPAYLGSIVLVSLMPNFFVCVFKLLHLPAKWQQLPSFWQYLTHLTFTHTLFRQTWDGIQGVYWSLGLEAQLYLVFPLVVWGFRRMGIRVLIPMLAASLIYRGIGAATLNPKDPANWTTNFLYSITFLGRWMEFAAGMLAAWIVAKRRHTPMSALWGTMLSVAAVLVYFLAVIKFDDFSLFSMRELLLSVAYATFAVAMCASRTGLRKVMENRVMVFLGLISYSVFLLHQNMMFYFGELMKKVLKISNGEIRFAVLITVGFALTVAISYVSYLLLERPWASGKTETHVKRPAGSRTAIEPETEPRQNGFSARDAVA